MRQYFIHDGQNVKGPFEIEQLLASGVKKHSPVWTEGFSEWRNAGEVDELKHLFASIPPPYKSEFAPTPNAPINTISTRKRNKKPILWAILIVVAFLSGFVIYNNVESCTSNNSGDFFIPDPIKRKTPEELRQELFIREKENPLQYLQFSGGWRENLIGQIVLQGSISNTATMAKFKDVVLEVTWYTKTGTAFGSEKTAILEYFPPGQSVDFKVKLNPPSSPTDVQIHIVNASIVE